MQDNRAVGTCLNQQATVGEVDVLHIDVAISSSGFTEFAGTQPDHRTCILYEIISLARRCGVGIAAAGDAAAVVQSPTVVKAPNSDLA